MQKGCLKLEIVSACGKGKIIARIVDGDKKIELPEVAKVECLNVDEEWQDNGKVTVEFAGGILEWYPPSEVEIINSSEAKS